MKGRVVTALAGAMLLGAVSAEPAQAQLNYYTQGWFTSSSSNCNGVAPAVGAPLSSTCVMPGFELAYAAKGANPGLIASGSVVSLGNFALTVTGSASITPGNVFFTMAIQQTDPTTGAGTLVGSLSGAVMMNNDFSSIMWIPSASSLTIGSTTYDFIFNGSGPAANRGYAIAVNNAGTPTSIQAVVATSAAPEPASLVLLGTGLLGIAGVVRRRRVRIAMP